MQFIWKIYKSTTNFQNYEIIISENKFENYILGNTIRQLYFVDFKIIVLKKI